MIYWLIVNAHVPLRATVDNHMTPSQKILDTQLFESQPKTQNPQLATHQQSTTNNQQPIPFSDY